MDDCGNRVAIIAGLRTPFVKAGTHFRHLSALDLAVHSTNALLQQQQIHPNLIDELVYGTVIHNPHIADLAREVVLASHLNPSTPAHSVSNNCVSGLRAITNLYHSINSGQSHIGLAGGTESMSNPPLLLSKKLTRILLELRASNDWSQRLKQLAQLRPWHIKPQAPAIAEPSTGLSMGEHCELMAKEWKIARTAQDEYALRSHTNASDATAKGILTHEIAPLENITSDTLIRRDTNLKKLAKLQPVFDKSARGTITAGNASPLTDGAATVLMCSEQAAKEHGWQPLAYIKAFTYAAINPKEGLLMAPALAVPQLLEKTGLKLTDIDLIEVHEAFAAQVLCNVSAWDNGWKEPTIGTIDMNRFNINGGSIALGHPFAATGARMVTTLANSMQRHNSRYGLISICAAGAMAGAMILERANH